MTRAIGFTNAPLDFFCYVCTPPWSLDPNVINHRRKKGGKVLASGQKASDSILPTFLTLPTSIISCRPFIAPCFYLGSLFDTTLESPRYSQPSFEKGESDWEYVLRPKFLRGRKGRVSRRKFLAIVLREERMK